MDDDGSVGQRATGTPADEAGDRAAGMLGRVVLNLTTNGLKFTEAGVVQLDVQPSKDGKSLLFRVSDTGIGMSGEHSIGIIGKLSLSFECS